MGPAWGFVSWVLCGRPGVLRPLPAVRSRISAVVSHCRTLCALLFVTCETVSVRETAFPGGNHDTKSGWTLRGGGLPTTESCITSEIHATRITDRTHSLSDGSHRLTPDLLLGTSLGTLLRVTHTLTCHESTRRPDENHPSRCRAAAQCRGRKVHASICRVQAGCVGAPWSRPELP